MSRLDRLVTLLDTGSTPLVRNTAASQLADIQKSHPDDIFNLLNRIVPYLRSKSWETRTASAKAIGGIVENAEKWDPNRYDRLPPKLEEIKDEELNGDGLSNVKSEETGESYATKLENGLYNNDFLKFESLDIYSVIKNGKKLFRSSGKEYDFSLADLDPAERLALQKKNVMARLGISGEYMEEEIVNEKDFATALNALPTPKIDTSVAGIPYRHSVASPAVYSPMVDNSGVPQTPNEDGTTGLSKRQQNMLKRKAKQSAKNHANKVRVVDLATPSRRQSVVETSSTPHPLKQEGSTNGNGATQDYFSLEKVKEEPDEGKIIVEHKKPVIVEPAIPTATNEEWPFERLCDILKIDMFDTNWEVRHGALMALREVIRVHGGGAGREEGKSKEINDALNKQWLDDLGCRLTCVFMLDKFGDFVSDNVVAPIRETTAQVLGALLLHLPQNSVLAIYRILHRLVMQHGLETLIQPGQSLWEICHGGMLGLKYLVAVRNDLLVKDPDLLDGVVHAVIRGLADSDDDVRAVSAATLVPIAAEFITLRPEAVEGLVNVVWECLSHLKDDLSASTGSVMDLLAKLCSFPQVLETMRVNASKDATYSFANLVPRLYPFLRHTITSVRTAVLKALLTFLAIEGEGTKGWIDGKILRLIFQNLLVERNEAVLNLSLQVWISLTTALTSLGPGKFAQEFEPHVDAVFSLLSTPIGAPRHPHAMDLSLFLRPSGQTFGPAPTAPRPATPPQADASAPPAPKRRRKSEKKEEPQQNSHNVDAHVMQGDVDLVGVESLMKMKIAGAKAFGLAMSLWPKEGRVAFFQPRLHAKITSPYSTTQLIGCMVVEEYFRNCKDGYESNFITDLQQALDSGRTTSYRDHVPYLQIVRAQCHSLLNTFRDASRIQPLRIPQFPVVVQGDAGAGPDAFTIAVAESIVGELFNKLKRQLPSAAKLMSTQNLADAKQSAEDAIVTAKAAKDVQDMRIRSAVASAFIAANFLPKKLGPVIKAVMESIKLEENLDLQKRSAASVASLISSCSSSGRIGIAEKVTKNLCAFLCVDTSEVPEFHRNEQFTDNILSLRKEEDRKEHADQAQFERDAKAARIKRRGAKEALEHLVERFGNKLFEAVPTIRTSIIEPLHKVLGTPGKTPETILRPEDTLGQECVDALSILRALLPKFHKDLYPTVIELFPLIKEALQANYSVLRYAAAKCFATICSVITIQGMTTLVEQILPMIQNAGDLKCRQGAVECVYHLIHVMDTDILPYVVFLIVPILGRMSDSDNDIRLIATTTFATLVKLVPLEAGIPDPPGLSEELLRGRDRERKFISQMLDVHKVEPFELPVAIKAELRHYQQEGVNWLAFLNKYHLHGILCDDMGLGKTLQTICILASDHYLRAEEYKKTGSPEVQRLPSLIVCPPSLSGHWLQEIKQFAPFLTALAYIGGPAERARVRSQLGTTDIVITSYDICRNDVENIVPHKWNYCVLDEGHIIKNSKAKLTQAVKRIQANHRLILSGTPIQNNVLELWSLFDFLMPGFLGTEKVFLDRFAKPIAASRNSKSSSKEQEAGALAIEALHKQVLPFLLRRLKEDVLDDLPPKIIQNYYCELSELQKRLYENFTKKQGKELAATASADDKGAKQHIFQALQYMRKLCNSPALVLNEKHPQYQAVSQDLVRSKTTVRDPIHAPKLFALRDLLLDCGIGVESQGNHDITTGAISQHRALIFCQLKEMLDIVENDVLKKLLPTVTYLRMDGGTDPRNRQNIVTQFNGDPSIDCLILTTHVGGLGLNLTGADTVIFVEHDWNPQKDMQAMDRAHRIGQKKVVNVYRLVTRGTLEEKIMSLQRFKLDVASTVVNQQNAGLATMETDQILDLFNFGDTAGAPAPTREEDLGENQGLDVDGQLIKKGGKSVLDEIGELWDENQYDEFDLGNFIATLQN